LHTGTWGGMFSKILYALAALIGGFLPISGYYMWWKRTSAKKKKAKA
ncbi:PepSY domain-containing protein, partial [Hoylesella nanceiensis]